MELRCPSCGISHRTEDYPGAFEINCVCGYSILVPDEKAFAVPVDERGGEAVPTSMEEEDRAISVSPAETEGEAPASAEAMTAPENLPSEMPYDRFELRGAPAPAEPGAEGMIDPGADLRPPGEMPAPAGEMMAVPEAMAPPDAGLAGGFSEAELAEAAPAAAAAVPSPPAAPPTTRPARRAPEKAAPQTTGQSIVERTLASSMGQFLGPAYKLQWQGLRREQLVVLAHRLAELTKNRPWVELELERRGIRFDAIPDSASLSNLPEILAVELYLGCFEMGGRCSFEKEA